jgi:hypothetical protein
MLHQLDKDTNDDVPGMPSIKTEQRFRTSDVQAGRQVDKGAMASR